MIFVTASLGALQQAYDFLLVLEFRHLVLLGGPHVEIMFNESVINQGTPSEKAGIICQSINFHLIEAHGVRILGQNHLEL